MYRTLVDERLTPFCRDEVDVFYRPSRLGHSLEEVLPLCRDAVDVFYIFSRLGHSLGGSLTPVLRCSRCILNPQPTGSLVGWRLTPQLSEEMQSMYFTSSADWVTRWLASYTPTFWRDAVDVFYILSRIGSLVGWRLTPQLWRDAVDVFYSPCRLGWTNIEDKRYKNKQRKAQ